MTVSKIHGRVEPRCVTITRRGEEQCRRRGERRRGLGETRTQCGWIPGTLGHRLQKGVAVQEGGQVDCHPPVNHPLTLYNAHIC